MCRVYYAGLAIIIYSYDGIYLRVYIAESFKYNMVGVIPVPRNFA